MWQGYSTYPILTPMSAVEGAGERSQCARAYIQWLRKFPERVMKHLRQKHPGKAPLFPCECHTPLPHVAFGTMVTKAQWGKS